MARVALVHDWLTGMRGGEKVLECLAEMYPEAELYTLICCPGKISPPINRLKTHTSFLQKLPLAKKLYRFYLPLMPLAIERFDLKDYDFIFSSSHCVAKAAKPSKKALHVCYCHAPMRYAYELFGQYFGRKNFLYRGFLRLAFYFLRHWDRKTASRVDFFIANSKNTARKIKEYYGREATVINPPVDTEFFTPAKGKKPGGELKAKPARPFYLMVSALVPYKQVDLAVKAFNRLGKRLVVIGSGVEMEKLKATAKGNIEFLGWQSNEAIRAHYRQCQALIFPGEEDFGITAVEAQSCGKPVIALGKGGCLETVIEGKTGHFFHQQSAEGLIKAVQEFEKMQLKAKDCRENAERYGRQRFKQEIKRFLQGKKKN